MSRGEPKPSFLIVCEGETAPRLEFRFAGFDALVLDKLDII